MRVRTVVAVVVALVVLAGAALGGVVAYYSLTKQPAPWAPHCTATLDSSTVRLDPAQARNAAIIAGVASRRGLPTEAVVIGLATAFQESGLRNLDHGDRDSLGLFQQRPSQGWGTQAQVQDPWYAADAFFAAMAKVSGWKTRDVGDVAQAVQKSGYPDAYDKHVPSARALASALTGDTPAGFTCSPTSTDADAAGLADFLTRTLPKDARVKAAGTRVTVEAGDARAAWAAAEAAVAAADGYGVRQVSVADRTWRRTWPLGAEWSAGALAGAAATTVVVSLA